MMGMMSESVEILIRQGGVQEIVDLRWRILRAGLERQTAFFDGDNEPGTVHLVACRARNIIGCATILQRPWQDRPAWQLRGMAVEQPLQRAGIGTRLLEQVEQTVRQNFGPLQLWCNARTPATPFYQRLGWRIEGLEFVIPTAGPHFKMSKLLKESPERVR
jgi:GNAT superfamily N-acetyltransferase